MSQVRYHNLEERLIANSCIAPEMHGSCWVWIGRRLPDGYGLINIRREGKHKAMRAHRVAYEEFTGGRLSTDDEIDHTCHLRCCINPDHLRKVGRLENLANRRGYRS